MEMNLNLAERGTLALNSDIIKKQFEGIIAKFDNSNWLSGSIEKIHEAACRSEFGKYDSIADKVSSLSFII